MMLPSVRLLPSVGGVVLVTVLAVTAGCEQEPPPPGPPIPLPPPEVTLKHESFLLTETLPMTRDVEKTEDQWREQLTPEQYHVVREKGTERPFTGEYDNHYKKGTYHCIACGVELFGSDTKFDAGCGWPSFSDVANNEHIELQRDLSHGMNRVEVLCKRCGGHLGHVFEDGPQPTGLRYCINSVSLDFRPE